MSKKWSEIMPIPGLADPPWGRQKGEGTKQHLAFRLYRDADPRERSYEKVAAEYGCNRSQIAGWSKKFRWPERIDRWDQHVEVMALKAQEAEIVAMNARHAGVGVEMLKKVIQRLTGDDVENVQAINASHLSAADLARLSEVAVKLERLARGSETERIGLGTTPEPVRIKFSFDPTPNIIGNPEMAEGMIGDYKQLPPAA